MERRLEGNFKGRLEIRGGTGGLKESGKEGGREGSQSELTCNIMFEVGK